MAGTARAVAVWRARQPGRVRARATAAAAPGTLVPGPADRPDRGRVRDGDAGHSRAARRHARGLAQLARSGTRAGRARARAAARPVGATVARADRAHAVRSVPSD